MRPLRRAKGIYSAGFRLYSAILTSRLTCRHTGRVATSQGAHRCESTPCCCNVNELDWTATPADCRGLCYAKLHILCEVILL